jgi:hypothetical protein
MRSVFLQGMRSRLEMSCQLHRSINEKSSGNPKQPRVHALKGTSSNSFFGVKLPLSNRAVRLYSE